LVVLSPVIYYRTHNAMKQIEIWRKDMGGRISKKLRSERSAATLWQSVEKYNSESSIYCQSLYLIGGQISR
jgi:hypothetical protein